MNLCDKPTIEALLKRHGFRFSKSLGQNFLIEDWVPRRIAEACGADTSCGVLEIGPGIGPLTRELCRRAGRVAAVELDTALLPILSETMADCGNFTLVPGDILELSIPDLAAEHFSGLRPLVCANLPYHITTPILTALVKARCFASITVMVQREVAERIAAVPGPEYGAFSVFMQYYTEPQVLFEVPRECFLPAPKVTSAVLHCPVRPAPAVSPRCGEAFFFRTVRAAFAQRRKTLVNSLASAYGDRLTKEELRTAVTDCGLPETIRGERLCLEDFSMLSDAIADRILG